MPQQKQVSWAQLRVGALVLVSLAAFAVAIFFISGRVGFFTRRYTLKAYFADAGGLREGSEVLLAGVAVGNVQEVRISSYPEPARAVEITMRIPRPFQPQIRADSEAALETTGVLGEKRVNITRGKLDQPVVRDGGVIKSREEADIKRIVQNTNDVISNLRVLSAKLNDVVEHIQSSQGSLGKLINDESFYNRLNETAGGIQRLVAKVDRGEGTLGRFMSDETLYVRMTSTMDHLNQITDDIQHGKGSFSKFISDPSMYDDMKKTVDRAYTLVDNINKGEGTLGKLARDPELYNRVNTTFEKVNLITTRIEQGQGTLGKLSTDATLFNNLSESSQSLREFLTEFRKNPKKFLTVHIRLF